MLSVLCGLPLVLKNVPRVFNGTKCIAVVAVYLRERGVGECMLYTIEMIIQYSEVKRGSRSAGFGLMCISSTRALLSTY